MTPWAIAGITPSPQFLESPETAKYQAGPSLSAPFDWPDIGGVKRQETKIYEKRRFIPSVRSKTSESVTASPPPVFTLLLNLTYIWRCCQSRLKTPHFAGRKFPTPKL